MSGTPVSKSSQCLLVVDDNAMNRDMVSRRLIRRGYTILQAEDAHRGIEMTRRGGIDLILMDMSLPELDGWAATRILKADSSTRHIPIVALTAHAMVSDREAALAAGCSDFETKPIDMPRLLATIRRLLGRDA